MVVGHAASELLGGSLRFGGGAAFFRWSWVDYDTLRPWSLRLLPVEGHLASWRQDYEAMAGSMFFGKVPSFDDILEVVGEFERRFRRVHEQGPFSK